MDMEHPDGATPLDPDEMQGLKFKHIQTRGELDEVEQHNIQEGLKWLSRQRKHQHFLNDTFLKDLHKQLFGQVWAWAGSYRQTEKNIGIDPLYITVELQKLMDDTSYWLEKSTYNRTEFSARFHHRLVQIHAFPNGNGRHARIMTDVILEKCMKTSAIEWAGAGLISDSEHRTKYIQALRAADAHDIEPLIKFVEGVSSKK